jgi:hypothetical protein
MYQNLDFFSRRRAIIEMNVARNGFECVRIGAYNRKAQIVAIRQAILRARRDRIVQEGRTGSSLEITP